MVKTPRTRHSNSERDPVTIELGPDDVSRVATEEDAASAAEPEAVKEDIGASEAAVKFAFRSNEQRAGGRRTGNRDAFRSRAGTGPGIRR